MIHHDDNDPYLASISDEVLGDGGDPGTLEYIASLQELSEAGLGDGFSIRHIALMPEHESEFVPVSAVRAANLEDELQTLNGQLNTASGYRLTI